MKLFFTYLLIFVFSFLVFTVKAQDLTLDSINVVDVSDCYAGTNGSLTIYVSLGHPPYSYSIDGGSSYHPGNVFNGLASGVYSVFVKDQLFDIVSAPVFIDQPDEIFIANVEHTNVTGCFGNNNGTITITASGGTGVLEYSIDNGLNYFANGGNFIGLIGGSYDIKVRDANLCVQSEFPEIISQPLELVITNEVLNHVVGCSGDDNGNIDIITTGGTAPINYSIDNGGSFHSNHYFSPLAPGIYPVVVRDHNGCITNGSHLVLNGPSPVVIDSQTSTDVNTCYNEHTGTITITASGGTGLLYYSIDGGINFQNNGNFNNLFAGLYEITVKDENGCTVNGTDITINEPPELLIDSIDNSNVTSCFGDSTAQIIIYAHGGIAPLEYSIESFIGFQPSNTINNLPYGTYKAIVRDANLCTEEFTGILISQPVQLTITKVSTTNVYTCSGDNDGTITITTNGGGTQPYNFSIDGGLTFPHGNNINSLFAGVYDIVVRDASNCTDTFDTHIVEITEPDEVLITSEIPQDPSCYGGSNGTITVTAVGGTNNYQYSADNGAIWGTNPIIAGLSAGTTYIIRVRDTHYCEVLGGTHVLNQPPELVIDTIIKQDVNDCFGGTNGSISIQVSGGTPPYEYSIDGGSSYQATGDYFGLDNGNYPIRVRDNNGCNIYGGIIRINQPDFFTVASQSSVNVQGCHGDLTGQIHFDVTGGTPHSTNGYQYSVDGGTNFYYNDGDFTGLGAGSFIPVAQDENGCLAYGQPIVITEPDTLILNIVSQQNVLCYSGSTGYINLMAEGGEYPFTFSINGGLNYSTGTFFPGLTAGTYQTYVKDDYNCISEGPTVVITQPDSLTISDVLVTNIEGCYGDDDGVISITVTNGVAPYSYSIDNGNSYYDDNGGTFTNLTPGNYYIRVIDSNYCTGFSDLNHDTFIDTFVITQPPQLQIIDYEKHDITCFGETDGSLQIFAAGGTGDIHYSIDNGLTYPVTTGLFEHLSQGTYLMRISDDNGCSSSAVSVSIYEPELFEITDILVEDETCPGLNDGSIRFYINGGTFPYRFSSDNGLTFQSYNIISNLAPGTYYPAAIDTNTCMAFWPEITIDSAVYAGLFTTDVTEGCSPLDVQFTRISEGVTYLWDFDDETTSNQNEPLHTFINTTLNPVTFTVTAYSVSPNNCLDTTYTDITVYPLPQLHFSANPDTAYYPDATIEIINNSPEGYTDYYWDFGDGSTSFAEEPLSHTYGDCGEYMIKMSADNLWCTDSVEKNILVTTFQPEAFFETDTTQSCWPVTINFSNQSHFITDFEWNLGDGTMSNENIFSHTYDTPGSYTVTLNTDGWCGTQDTYDTIITVFESPVVDFDVSPDTVMLPSQPIHCVNLSSDDSELYFWAFGDGGTSTDEDPVWQYLQPGTFYISLTVTSVNKCVDSLTLAANVVVLPEGKILLPNAFTPNNDGFSDVFMPAVYNSVKSFSFEIFNRWGEKVFYSNDINVGWNGYFNGSLAPQDVYIWRINGLYLNGTPFENAGSITLIR